MIRARLPLAALLGAALSFAGCVKTDDDVTVKPDGSGSFTESMVVDLGASAELAEAMKAMGPLRGPRGGMNGADQPPEPPMPPPPGAPPPEEGAKPADAPQPPADPLDRLKARWKDVTGLEVTKATTETKDGKAHLRIEATFQTLEAYAQATGIEMGSTLVKNDDGSYTLTFEMRYPGRGRRPDGGRRDGSGMGEGPPGGMEDGAPGMEGGEAPPGGGAGGMGAMGGMMQPLLEKHMTGLEFTRKLRLPGSIVETNGMKSEDGTTVSWKLTYDDLKGGKPEPQTVRFKGEGLDLKPFTVRRSPRRTWMGGGPGGPGGRDGPGAPGAPGAPGGGEGR